MVDLKDYKFLYNYDRSKHSINWLFKFRSPQFLKINIFWEILNEMSGQSKIGFVKSIRIRFFSGNYLESIKFLQFCNYLYWALGENDKPFVFKDTEDRGSESKARMIEQSVAAELRHLSIRYIRYFDSNFNSFKTWKDREFDILINIFLTFFLNNPTFSHFGLTFVRRNFNWGGWLELFIFPSYKKYFRLSSTFSLNLVFNSNKKFFLNSSAYKSWSYSIRTVSPTYLGVTSRSISSFQIHFNYADAYLANRAVSNFNHIHWFNPIFPEMRILPFIVTPLRPNFNNLKAFHTLEQGGKLYYSGVYHMKTKKISRFVFDRYFYEHGRLLLSLPFKYRHIPQVKYILNFGSVIRSLQFDGYFNYFSCMFSVNSLEGITGVFSFLAVHDILVFANMFSAAKTLFRKKIVIQIISEFWKILNILEPYFFISNFVFRSQIKGQVIMDERVRRVPDESRIFFGASQTFIFERITDQFLVEFAKFLYGSPMLFIVNMLNYVSYQKGYISELTGNWGIQGFHYFNLMTEIEMLYRNNPKFNLYLSKSIFETWFFDFIEQFYDYELWLYTYVQSFVKFVNYYWVENNF